MKKFNHYINKNYLKNKEGFLFLVPEKIENKLDIFESFGSGLLSPNKYFGKNWDAFNDCLMDLQWIYQYKIYIFHEDIPQLSDFDIKIYLSIIFEAQISWSSKKTDELSRLFPELIPHKLYVYFKKDLKDKVESIRLAEWNI